MRFGCVWKKCTQHTPIGMRADRLYPHVIINACVSPFFHSYAVKWNEIFLLIPLYTISSARQFFIHLFAFELPWCTTPNTLTDWRAKNSNKLVLHIVMEPICGMSWSIWQRWWHTKKRWMTYINIHNFLPENHPHEVIFMIMHSLNGEHWTLRNFG